jgi:hypothetical protein
VLQWVAYPDGSHHTMRVAVTGGGALAPYANAAAANTAALAGATFKLRGRAARRTGMGQHFAPVADNEDALDAIRAACMRFFVLAALNLVFGYLNKDVLGSFWYVDGLLVGGLAFALKEMHSRVAAGLLLVMSVLAVLLQVLAMMAGSLLIGRLVLWVVMSGMSYRALMATMSLHRSRAAAALA